jgi:hypothetical protein
MSVQRFLPAMGRHGQRSDADSRLSSGPFRAETSFFSATELHLKRPFVYRSVAEQNVVYSREASGI